MTADLEATLRTSSRRGTILGIVLIVLGVLAMVAPLMAGLAVATVVAVLLVAAGIARFVWAFQAGSFGKGALVFLLGGLLAVTGVLMLARPLVGLASLTLLLAAFFAADGIFEVAAALKVRPEAGWGWLLCGGIVSLVLAGLIWWEWPLSGAWAIGILVGVKLLFAGTAMVALSSMGRGLADRIEDAV